MVEIKRGKDLTNKISRIISNAMKNKIEEFVENKYVSVVYIHKTKKKKKKNFGDINVNVMTLT